MLHLEIYQKGATTEILLGSIESFGLFLSNPDHYGLKEQGVLRLICLQAF